MKRKVVFLTNIISPYRRPVFEYLSERVDWDFSIVINAQSEFDRSWEVETSGLPVHLAKTFTVKRNVRSRVPISFTQVIALHIPYGLGALLKRLDPDVVISHELGIRTAMAAIYCRMRRKPLVIWSYQSRVSATQGSWRDRFRKALLRRASCCVGMGKQAREVLTAWGVPSRKIVDAPNAANYSEFEKALRSPDAGSHIARLRNEWSKGKKIALVAGRLVPLKGIDSLLRAWERLPTETREAWVLIFVGDGPLASLVDDCGLQEVERIGFMEPSSMPYVMAAADLHIFPTLGDVWGLAVNEASHAGTPTLCSPHAGCSDDLIEDGVSGLLADFADTESAVKSLDNALNRDDLPTLGKVAREKAADCTTERLAQGFIRAVDLALADRLSEK